MTANQSNALEDSPMEESAGDSAESDTQDLKKRADPAKRLTRIVLAAVAVLFSCHMAADRYTPYTPLGRIDGFIVPVVPQVSGYLTEVNVRLHDAVTEHQVIVQIDPLPYELALQAAQASLELAGQQMGAQVAGIEAAAGRLGVSQARYDITKRNLARVEKIAREHPGALSEADLDQARASVSQSESSVISSQANLLAAQEQLGVEGDDNPNIRAAVAAVAQAQFNLTNTTLHAPSDGVMGDIRLGVGHYAMAGQPLATFISSVDGWVQVDMKENNLGRMKVGDRAEIVLDAAPGKVFQGEVVSIGFGIETSPGGSLGELQTTEQAKGWLQDPKRFPVIL
ncbi:MAG: efflux RND transporter periplasmic adaptor subunit, partial [Gemmatimonadales bacterium]